MDGCSGCSNNIVDSWGQFSVDMSKHVKMADDIAIRSPCCREPR